MAKARQVTRYRDSLHTERRKHLRNRVLFVVGIFVLVVVSLVYLLFFAHIFDVRAVAIESDIQTSDLKQPIAIATNQWLNESKFFLQRRRNMIFLNIGQLQSKLTTDFPKIDSISISRHPFHELEISIKERSPQGIWCLGSIQQCFYFNKAGIIYEEAPQTSGFLILTVQDNRDRQVNLGDKIAGDDWFGAINSSYNKLTDKKFKIKSLTIPKGSIDEFDVLTSSNLKILLSIDTDINSQIDAMVSFLAQKLSPDRVAQLQYVDLRIQDHIYYK